MARDRRSRRRRLLRGLLWGIAALQVLEALKLRARRDQVRALPPTGEALPSASKLAVSALAGSQVDQATLAAVAAEMEATGAEVVDLVPADMPAHRALAFLRRVDPGLLSDDPSYSPGGASEAVAVHGSVAERMGSAPGVEALPDRGALLRRTTTAQRYAPGNTVVRLAPSLRSAPSGARDRWTELEALARWTRPYVSTTGAAHGIELAWLALLTAGPFLAPLPGLAALAAWCAQPALVFGSQAKAGEGTDGAAAADSALSPPDTAAASLLRLPRAWLEGLATAAVGVRAGMDEAAEVSRKPVPPEADVEPTFEPRLETCPWCGARALEELFQVPDLLQQKKGIYHLDECQECGHVFQNPQLTQMGLNFIYSDAYHGLGGETAEVMQARCMESYWGRANAVARFTEPAHWLDIGSSYGHFFLAARKVFPKTTFDALDVGSAMLEGHRRGWIDNIHQGFFPELADDLPRYDVVSMHHYLEHTRDPHVEIETVKKVLEPGGYLMIEVPDPESPWSRRLGRYWWQWGQPQHLHFVTLDNLVAELGKQGYEVLSIERGQPAWGNDLTVGLLFWAQSVSRATLPEWLPPPTLADRLKRAAVMGAVMPGALAAQVVDQIDVARVRKTDDVSNVYRVVARRNEQ